MMISQERWLTFLDSLMSDETDAALSSLRKRAGEDDIPIIRRESEYFLRWLVADRSPKRILEIGAAIGYSAICMRRAAGEDVHITTIENYPPRIRAAKENFKNCGEEEYITLLEGDASDILREIDAGFDFVFLDGPKGQYPMMLDSIEGLVEPGGLLVTDNILQDGDTLESRFTVRRRDRTIHERMREYLYEITHRRCWNTDILPIGDGMAISSKKL